MTIHDNDLTCDAFLGGALNLWQPKSGYRAATDPVLLAAACPAKPTETILELGCGVGVASLCVLKRISVDATGVELQPAYADLARRNAQENKLPFNVVTADLTQLPKELGARSFDHVIMNPPYFGPGTPSTDPGRDTAMREETALSDWLDHGLKRLKPKGWLTLIHRVEALQAVLSGLGSRAGCIEIKPLIPRPNRDATRFILRARKTSKAPLRLCNPLILHKGAAHLADQNDYTEPAENILRHAGLLDF